MSFKTIKMETKKAFKITVKDLVIDEPWHYTDIIVYADSHGEAKNKGMREFELGEIIDYTKKNWKGEYLRDITYLDIRARRIKSEDKILYKGEWETRERISQLEWQDKRDEKAKQLWINNPDGIAVVWVGCYGAYWGANRSGYYSKIENAGKYSTKEAYDIVKGSCYDRQEIVQLLDKEKYNAELQKKIDNLQNNLL